MSLARAASVACLVAACGPAPAGEGFTDLERALVLSLELVDTAPPPDPTNRFADDPAAAALGKRLFEDAALSLDGTLSCRTCHDPARDFTDGLRVGEGRFAGTRNTPTIRGAAWSPWLFWDGRKDSAWSQALGPLENPTEHAITRLQVVRRLAQAYGTDWARTFGPLPVLDDALPERARPVAEDPFDPDHVAWTALDAALRESIDRTFADVGKAIAAYERTLAPRRTRFDAFAAAMRRREPSAEPFSEDEVEGLRLFVGRANCVACHAGPRFTNDSFHNLGLPDPSGARDRGRAAGARQVLADPFNCRGPFSDAPAGCDELVHLDPGFRDFEGAFRTPSLRGVARTFPYMHDGSLATLDDVLAFYSELPLGSPIGHRELTLVSLHLTDVEKRRLKAFLASLTPEPEP